MSALGNADLQDIAEGNWAPQSDKADGRIVLPPFVENLSVDYKLNLSNENFNETINGFFKEKDITHLSQLTAPPTFPTPHVLAQFASKAYEGYKTGETDAQYEERLALPEGWELLTTASNSNKTNGYFGAAYWHPEHQQVVIAHRGTNPKSLGALRADVKGVLLNQYVSQMDSATTFAHKVVEVLQTVRRMNGVSFQLFFTGHSLGGWLAQVTTFTTEYLKTESNIFLKRNNDQDYFHPHTVVFDSPGCKDMLSQMKNTYFARHDERSIDLKHLDITSYLSAPNRINTCNTHLGTVYRIFPDMSDTVWLISLIVTVCRIITYLCERVWLTGIIGIVCRLFTYCSDSVWFTGILGPVYCFFSYLSDAVWQINRFALYTLATHSIDKIVQAFDPETGQVHKNEQGQLQMKVVIDWPISTGLRGGEEYKKFFEWAEKFKNYHPDTTDEFFRYLHYCPIRYQTELYNERVNSLSVFSQEEQEFIKCYRGLREWLEFCKPKELFAVMGDDQAQEQAGEVLQSFEIKNDTIHCTDASALEALIPYVKRLLQLFPQTKRIKNRVLQCETRPCVQRISQSPLEFNSDASSIRGFVESEQQKVLHLRMFQGDEWTGLIKAYQLLQKANCLMEDQYTVLKLDSLLTLNKLLDFSTLRLSNEVPYLMVVCEAAGQLKEETKGMIRKLLENMKKLPLIKVILTTRSEDGVAHFLQHIGGEIFGNGFVTRDEQLNWCDLTYSSQEKLLEKSVIFQDAKISLNQLMSAEFAVANFLPLGALLEEKELKIVDPVPIANGYNEIYYIGRTLRHQIAINVDIFSDKNIKEKQVFLASTEAEYKELCQLHPESNVHWLENDKSRKLLWQHSQGSLETVRRYIDTESSPTYTADDLDKLLDQAQHQRVMVITDTAGMGKSTVLTHLSKQIKQKFPTKLVVRIDLNDHTDALRTLKQEHIDKEKATEFVSEKLLKLEPGLEMELFKEGCEQKQKVRIIIMLDGFDEISPFYKQTVIGLLQALRQTEVEQLWVTTRPHLRRELEDRLQQLSYTLEPFSQEDQIEFLTKYWSLNDWFTEPNGKGEEREKSKLAIYAEDLIKKLAISISDKDRQLTGIPLLTRMLAEAFDEEVKTFYLSTKSMPELLFQQDLLGLYSRFIERKYDIYQKEKLQVSVNNACAIGLRERDLKSMRKDHQLLALKVLFTKKQRKLLQKNRKYLFPAEDLTRVGIVQVNGDGKPHFIHRTFAEYYVADCLVDRLTEGNNTSQQVQTFILKDIFLKEEYRVIRAFMDCSLSSSQQSKDVLKQYGNKIYHLGTYGETILQKAVDEGNSHIVGFLLDSMQVAEHRNRAKELLLALDPYGSTVWHIAVCCDNIHILEKLREWAERELTTEKINNKLVLAADYKGRTVWHVAAEEGNLEKLQKVWDWAKQNLTTDEINNKLLLATDDNGWTIWHVAAKRGNLEALEKVWVWANEKLSTEEIKNKLLLATDGYGRTVWHVAGEDGNLEKLQKVWDWAKENLTTDEINNKLLFATDSKGWTIWHVAAEDGNLEALQKVWDWAKETLRTDEIYNKLLLATDNKGWTVWHVAAEDGNLEALQKIWDWTKETLRTDEINNKLLLATDNKGWTVWHLAALRGNIEALQKIWVWVNEKLTTGEITNKLLLAAEVYRRTVWHVAADDSNLEKLQSVWDWAKNNLSTEVINHKLLLAKDGWGRTFWHVAANRGNLEALENVWVWANGNLTTEEINNKLLFATDNKGWTIWHVAAHRGNLEALQKVWVWANEKLTTEEINNKLLLAGDNEGRTVWHVAALRGNLKALQKIWDWAKKKLTTEEINNKFLLATDINGRTVWHMAVEDGNLETLEKVRVLATEKVTIEKINNNLFLATDSFERTVWHVAALRSNQFLLEKLCEWAKEARTTQEMYNVLLSATDHKGRTVWQLAEERGKAEILEELRSSLKGN